MTRCYFRQKHAPLGVLLTALTSLLAPSQTVWAQPAPTYTYRIVALPGLDSRATAIDKFGRVVGTVWTGQVESTNTNVRIRQAALWTPDNQFENLHPTLSPSDVNGYASNAYGINNLGHIVGSVGQIPYTHQPFVWKPGSLESGDTKLFLLGRYAGTNGVNSANAINDVGSVAGSALMTDADVAFQWSEADGNALPPPLPPLSLGADSSTSAINNSGLIAGRSQIVSGRSTQGRAVVWNLLGEAGGTWQIKDLGTLGGDNSSAYDINDEGVVVGTAMVPATKPSTGNNNRAFRFRLPSGTMENLGTLGDFSSARGINNLGEIIGASRTTSSSPTVSIRFHDLVGLEDLSTCTEGANPFTRLDEVGDVSDVDPTVSTASAGQIIGLGTLASGEKCAFRMIPVEPDPTMTDPASPVVASVTTNSAKLTWAYGGAAPGRFRVDYKGKDGRWIKATVPGTSTSHIFTGLTSSTKYHFRVRAENVTTTGIAVSHFVVASATTIASTTKK